MKINLNETCELIEFVQSKNRNAWINVQGYKVFTRKSARYDEGGTLIKCIDIATIENRHNKSCLLKLINTFKEVALLNGADVFAECIINDRLIKIFKRAKFICVCSMNNNYIYKINK